MSRDHPALLKHLAPEDVQRSSSTIETSAPEDVHRKLPLSFANGDVIKALGLLWNSTTDKLIFCVQINQDKVPTKRSVLRSIASIYNPLGLYSPIKTLYDPLGLYRPIRTLYDPLGHHTTH